MKIYRENNAIKFDDESGNIIEVDPILLIVNKTGSNYTFRNSAFSILFSDVPIGDIKTQAGTVYSEADFDLFCGTGGLVSSISAGTVDAYTKSETNNLIYINNLLQ